MNKVLRPGQIEDLAYLMRVKRGGLFHDPAVGKTPPVCIFTWWLWDELKEKMAFVMPLSLFKKNKAELLEWTKFASEDIEVLTTVPREVQYLRLWYAARNGDLKLFALNDAKMMEVLRTAPKPTSHKAATKKALRLNWITAEGEITPAGREQLDKGCPIERYGVQEYRKQPEFVGEAVIAEMIKKRIINADLTAASAPDFSKLTFDAKVLVMGFDFWADNWKWLTMCNPQLKNFIGDELHLGFGHNDSQRTQSFYESMKKMDRFVPMTGTLINGRLDTSYPTIHVIEPRFYSSYQDFMNQHQLTDMWGKRIGWTGHERLAQILPTIGRRRTFEQEYGPEAKVMVTELVEMSPVQREKYDEFHDKALLELEDSFLDGTLPGVSVLRARQIMQCPEIFGLCHGEELGKDARLKIHLEDAAHSAKPFVIFSAFHSEQRRIATICDELELKIGIINGTVSAKERGEIDLAFRNGELQGIIGTEATAGVGLNWEHTQLMVFVSIDYQDGNFRQAYLRAIRGKRTIPLLLFVLGYARSVDQRIFQIVEGKSLDAHKVDPTREILRFAA